MENEYAYAEADTHSNGNLRNQTKAEESCEVPAYDLASSYISIYNEEIGEVSKPFISVATEVATFN